MEPVGVEGGEVSPVFSRGSNENSRSRKRRAARQVRPNSRLPAAPRTAFRVTPKSAGNYPPTPEKTPLSRSARSSPSATSPRSDGDAEIPPERGALGSACPNEVHPYSESPAPSPRGR